MLLIKWTNVIHRAISFSYPSPYCDNFLFNIHGKTPSKITRCIYTYIHQRHIIFLYVPTWRVARRNKHILIWTIYIIKILFVAYKSRDGGTFFNGENLTNRSSFEWQAFKLHYIAASNICIYMHTLYLYVRIHAYIHYNIPRKCRFIWIFRSIHEMPDVHNTYCEWRKKQSWDCR